MVSLHDPDRELESRANVFAQLMRNAYVRMSNLTS